MSLPSESEIRDAIGKRIKITDQWAKFGITNTPNYVTMEESYLAALDPDSTPDAQSGVAQLRAALAAGLSPAQLIRDLAPCWLTYSRINGYADTAATAIIGRLFEAFALAGTPVTVQRRAWTRNAASAGGSNVGTGSLVRCTTDAFNYAAEGSFIAETKTFRCIADEHSGAARHQERFSVQGAAFGKDLLNPTGSGIQAEMNVLAYDTFAFVANASFENVTIASGVTLSDLSGWTADVIANFQTETTTYYKDNPNSTTSRSLRFSTNAYIQQTFETQRINWNPGLPLFAQIVFYRESNCDGTLTVTIGGKTMSVALVAQSGWTTLRWAVDYDAWFRRWNASNAVVKIALSGRTTGTLLVDDFIVGPYTIIDGTGYVLVGGPLPFLKDDSYTVADTCSETGIIQKWLARTYGLYLPHAAAAPVWADPT